MGQGAPPISQQLKQLVDVEAQWQLGDFRNPGSPILNEACMASYRVTISESCIT
jgi:hypothetical protein